MSASGSSFPVPPPPDYGPSHPIHSNNPNPNTTSSPLPSDPPPPPPPSEPLTDAQLTAQLNASTLKFYKHTYLTFLSYYVPRLTLLSAGSFVLKLYLLPWLFIGIRWLGRWVVYAFEKLLFGLVWIASWGALYSIGIGILGGLLAGAAMWLWFEWPSLSSAYPRGSKSALYGTSSLVVGWIGFSSFKTGIGLGIVVGGIWIRSRFATRNKFGARAFKNGRLNQGRIEDLDEVDEATQRRLQKLREASEARRRNQKTTSTLDGTTTAEAGAHIPRKADEEGEGEDDDLMDREAERWARKAREEMLREELTRRARGAGGVLSGTTTRSEDVDVGAGDALE
ncbi:BZ3500_MvSof-1268-A1-R1_Chr2-2g04760 [Microbotryum saponariae]|uniref:BZ3500_MvSof-1268-A1-R1_Chr2-2g04760 protein n=1 Tax=Microbotryum saponariae TaxID=289078 RepID=A0A2X0L3R6_9BASI|nr:BZ3500_MvSof-1268-A1-R1_Chr2-2g04760 [Microbotryum saponariae]SDA00099.1 BZ3501_MvSof-1269-A2-R1_Chr2-2g04434 [Microbotryum saponariae]